MSRVIIELFAKELEKEALTTRKMLERVPVEHFAWAPHTKSMTLKRLAAHVAELPGWVGMALTTDELDFENNPYAPREIADHQDLLAYFEDNLADARAHLAKAEDEQLPATWTLRSGEQIYDVSPKADVIRMAFSQIIHHRAQLGVYLRLLNIPIPGSYGPSADESDFA